MNIIVVGCGKIGKSILSNLLAEGHDITVIDNDKDFLDEIANTYDVMTVCGNGADSESLTEAGVQSCDLFIACTTLDENNMLICYLAKQMGAKATIARVRNPEFNYSGFSFMKQQLGLSLTINPELLVAKEISQILKLPTAIKIESFSHNFEMVEIKLAANSLLDGMSIKEMREKYKAKYLICVVSRGSEVFIPDGNFVLKSGDQVGITAAPREIQKLFKMLGMLKKQAKNVMILGGGKSSYYLTKMLDDIGITAKIIDRDLAICQHLSSLLPDTVIINGDGTRQEVLTEEGLNETDALVALTGMDEENILVSIFAFLQQVPTVITKINREELSGLAEKIGLEAIISPLAATSNKVVQYARALQNSVGSNVETLYKLMDGKAEALEFNVVDNKSITNIPLKDLSLKKNTLIAGIIRGRKIIIPSGADLILSGDKVVVITAGGRMDDLADILD